MAEDSPKSDQLALCQACAACFRSVVGVQSPFGMERSQMCRTCKQCRLRRELCTINIGSIQMTASIIILKDGISGTCAKIRPDHARKYGGQVLQKDFRQLHRCPTWPPTASIHTLIVRARFGAGVINTSVRSQNKAWLPEADTNFVQNDCVLNAALVFSERPI
jgi:hypothetical protein